MEGYRAHTRTAAEDREATELLRDFDRTAARLGALGLDPFKLREYVPAADLRGAVSIVRDLLDPDPCRYDHHGYCQAHSLHERPCPHERARDLLGKR